jgi:hypothetical protein
MSEGLPRVRHTPYALVYAALLPGLQQIAREKGYALAVHGSMATDLDLVALPWTEEADGAEALVQAIKTHLGLIFHPACPHANPDKRPHGRRTWSLCFDPASDLYIGGPWIDLSVMPLGRKRKTRAG